MRYKLSEILTIIGGGTPKTTNSSYWGGNIPWLSVVDFNNDNRYVHSTEKTITEAGLKHSSTKILPKGALILSARGTVGALAQLSKPMAFNQSCYGIVATEHTTNDFLYYLLKTVVSDLQAKGHGSVFNTITRETFETIFVSLPQKDEQKRIAGVLGAFDDKIELLQKQNTTLENMANLMVQTFLKQNKVKERLLSDVACIKYGKGISSKQLSQKGYKVFGGNGIIGCYHSYLYQQPQILVSCRGAASGNVWESYPYSFITSNSLILELKDRKYYEFIKRYLKLHPLHQYATGSAQPQITIENLKNVLVPYPDFQQIEVLTNSLMLWSNKTYHNIQEQEILTELRDALLPRLISGKIRV